MPKIWNKALQTTEMQHRYRSKWACFTCKTSFSRSKNSALDKVHCPSCHKSSVDMGYLFEAPKRSDTKSWKIMQELAQNNYAFHTAGLVAFIRFRITNDGLASLSEVIQNIKNHQSK